MIKLVRVFGRGGNCRIVGGCDAAVAGIETGENLY